MASTTMTYTILTGAKSVDGSIKNWMNKSDIPVAQILDEAQAKLFNRLRLQEQIYTVAVALAEGDDHFDAPADLCWPLELRLNSVGEIPYIAENGLMRDRDEDGELYEGTPDRYSWMGDELQFRFKCDQAFGGRFTYYRSRPISSGTQTSFVTDKFPTLLRKACEWASYDHMKQKDMAITVLKELEGLIEEANAVSDMRRLGQVLR